MEKELEKECTSEIRENSRVRRLLDRTSQILNSAICEMVETKRVRHLTDQEKDEFFEADRAVNEFLDNYALRTGKILISQYKSFYKTV